MYADVAAALELAGCSLRLVPRTRDVWVRDFMPVPLPRGGLVQFRYAPSYLRTPRERATIPDTHMLCTALGLQPQQCELLLDGGNVVFVGRAAVVTDRVYSENPGLKRDELRQKLQVVLGVEQLLVVPAHPDDFTGHADGLVQSVDEHTVLVSAYRREPPAFVHAFRQTLALAGLSCVELPYNPYGNRTYTDAAGDYVNSLVLPEVVLVPQFGQREDELALRVYEQAFHGRRVLGIRIEAVAQEGGALHCITWTACSSSGTPRLVRNNHLIPAI
ncbi:agmatine deiminase family protein [Hymenobacter latericus]|uniref:agmatine deiminase family protein n=1 Tax=Hymenobacter sp. YIM 151858-1 TaxID=2987688 RepID=UPI0022272300|nr:agmatine deiminase family protein [Hymenobacter sp. YIM 151858-1]UYZ61072.1 agmatine deiminase family protein [Hymenobacter sp. YIM 151858-1]